MNKADRQFSSVLAKMSSVLHIFYFVLAKFSSRLAMIYFLDICHDSNLG